MNDTATQTQIERRGLELGARESQSSGKIFVNIRAGKIAQTSKTEVEGFQLCQTKNAADTVYTFYAKPYDNITGYVNDIRWHTHKLPDGTVLAGWNIEIETGEETFVLGIGNNERPFARLMNCLLNVDFELPVMFVGFMGENKKTKRPQKMLLLSQELGENGKPAWIQPLIEEKWLSRMVIDKLKQGIELSPDEEKNVHRTPDGKFSKSYPYITQKVDLKWSFDTWEEFLIEQMNDTVIPKVQAAAEKRGNRVPPPIVPEIDIPGDEFSGPASGADDDDIPF